MDVPTADALDGALDRSWDRPTARDWAGVLGRLPLLTRSGAASRATAST